MVTRYQNGKLYAAFKVLLSVFVISTVTVSCAEPRNSTKKTHFTDNNAATHNFDRCVQQEQNTYLCVLNKKNDKKKLKSIFCNKYSCTIIAAPRKYLSKTQGKGAVIYGYKNMPYALCSKSLCRVDKNKNMAICECPVINSKGGIASISLGPYARERSLPTYDKNDSLLTVYSTFSLMNVFSPIEKLHKNKPITLCRFDQPHQWADCFGVLCKIDKKNPLNAVCVCPIQKSKEFISVAGRCNSKPNYVYAGADPQQFELTAIYRLYQKWGKSPKRR